MGMKSFIIYMRKSLFDDSLPRVIGMGRKRGCREASTHTTALRGRRSIAAVHPSISVAGEADDDACIPPTQREKI